MYTLYLCFPAIRTHTYEERSFYLVESITAAEKQMSHQEINFGVYTHIQISLQGLIICNVCKIIGVRS